MDGKDEDKAIRRGEATRSGKSRELAVYSIIVIYFSNTNSSERRLLSSDSRIARTRVSRARERGRIRERVESASLSILSLAFCFPSHSSHPCLHASERNEQSSMNSRSFNANRAFFVPRDERLAGNQNFHDFIKERKKEGRKV